MKKLGLIGGVGPESTIPYYREIVYGVQRKLNKPCFPPLVIDSLSSFEVIRLSSQNDKAGLTKYLMTGIRNLASAGAEIGALACNTGHIVFDELQQQSPIPLISIVETACSAAQKNNMKKVGLLGTTATMKGDFFKKPFLKADIEVITPNSEDQAYIATHIVQEIELGIIKDSTAQHFIEISKKLSKENKLDAIILGCTELPLLFQNRHLPFPILDTMQLHIDALIEAILDK